MGFALSWNPCCKDTKLRVIKFPVFWQPENAISADSWNQRFKVTHKEGVILLIIESRKCDFAESWNPRLKGTKPHANKFSTFW